MRTAHFAIGMFVCSSAVAHVWEQFVPSNRDETGFVTNGLPYNFRLVAGKSPDYELVSVALTVNGVAMQLPLSKLVGTKLTWVGEARLSYKNPGYWELGCSVPGTASCTKPEDTLSIAIPFGESESCGNGPDGLARDELHAHLMEFDLKGKLLSYEIYQPCQDKQE